ncbi:MAG: hypothetical protein WC130_00725, partial [Kiritimatiellia bacterium]
YRFDKICSHDGFLSFVFIQSDCIGLDWKPSLYFNNRRDITIYRQRKHPDVRIARRATTIANLARVISERDVSDGLRRTLLTQARRLERLAAQRVQELGITADFKKKG